MVIVGNFRSIFSLVVLKGTEQKRLCCHGGPAEPPLTDSLLHPWCSIQPLTSFAFHVYTYITLDDLIFQYEGRKTEPPDMRHFNACILFFWVWCDYQITMVFSYLRVFFLWGPPRPLRNACRLHPSKSPIWHRQCWKGPSCDGVEVAGGILISNGPNEEDRWRNLWYDFFSLFADVMWKLFRGWFFKGLNPTVNKNNLGQTSTNETFVDILSHLRPQNYPATSTKKMSWCPMP